jgi:hypothetical protein
VNFLTNKRLEVDEVLVQTDPKDPGDVVAGVVGVIAVDSAGPEAAEAHFACSLGD